jgi:hypothetical protein
MMKNDVLKRAIELKDKMLLFVDCNNHDGELSDQMFSAERYFFIEHSGEHAPDIIRKCRSIRDLIACLKNVAF